MKEIFDWKMLESPKRKKHLNLSNELKEMQKRQTKRQELQIKSENKKNKNERAKAKKKEQKKQ